MTLEVGRIRVSSHRSTIRLDDAQRAILSRIRSGWPDGVHPDDAFAHRSLRRHGSARAGAAPSDCVTVLSELLFELPLNVSLDRYREVIDIGGLVESIGEKDAASSDQRGTFIVRDPVHDYFVLPRQLESIVKQWPIHRLRRITQTSVASLQYPSLTGTRFEHSLGTMHLARTAWREIWGRLPRDQQILLSDAVHAELRASPSVGDAQLDPFTTEWVEDRLEFRVQFGENVDIAIAAAGLLHDLGHPPYSHALEGFFSRNMKVLVGAEVDFDSLRRRAGLGVAAQFHEVAGLRLAQSLDWSAVRDVSKELVFRILLGGPHESWAAALHEIISGEVDVDRIDYIMRDSNRAGTEFGAIDSSRLFQSIELHAMDSVDNVSGVGWRVGFGYRARSAIETFLTNRIRYYQWVLFHYRVVAANKFLEEALEELLALESATPESPSDEAVSALFKGLRPNLAYFDAAEHQDYTTQVVYPSGRTRELVVRDFDSVRTAAEVDDAVIQNWLKEAARRARAIRSSKSGTTYLPRLAKIEALYDAVMFRAQNWVSLWEDEADYASVAERLSSPLVKILEEAGRSLADVSFSEDGGGLQEHRSLEILSLARIQMALQSNPARGLNVLADRFLNNIPNVQADGSSEITRHAREPWRRIASLTRAEATKRSETRLQQRLAMLPLQPGSVKVDWIISFQSTKAVKTGTEAVTIFKGKKQGSIAEYSTMVASLNDVTSRYPQLFVFAVVPNSMTVDLDWLASEARDHFVKTFIEWVKSELDFVISNSFFK